ncbi:MAG: DUF748 domain-containing protein [Deltaproteobacteria bacterium]|nr:DUF748 domain-containing protein [Deltaproteobacteria bacterium]
MIGKIIRIYENKLKPRLKKILVGLVIFFVVFTLVGFFVIPPVLKSILIKKLSENLHREVAITQIKVNPYALSLTVRGFQVKDRGRSETFLSFDELFVNLQSLSVLKFALVLKEIRLTNPYVKINRLSDMTFNFSDLIEKKTEAPPAEKGKPLRFSLNNIQLINGSIDLWDGPKQTKHSVNELNIGVPFISNIPSQIDIFVQPVFSAKINETPYKVQGNTKPFGDTLETVFDININDLDIPYYLAYLPIKLNFKIVSAFLDVQAKVSFLQPRDKSPSLTVTGNVALKKVALDDNKKNPLFRLPLLEIGIAPTEPLRQIIHLSKISIQSPELEVRRDDQGVVNLQTLLPEKSEAKSAPKKDEESAPLVLDIDEIQLTGGKVSFSDLSRNPTFKTIFNPIALKVDHFSNGKDKKSAYTLSLQTEAKENIKLEGEFSMDPLGAGGALEIKSIPLKKYAPYYRDNILFDIEEGRLDFSIRYKYGKGEKEPEVFLSGLTLVLNSLRLKKAEENEDFLKIPNFSIRETDVDLAKRQLNIGKVSIQKGDLSIKRFKNGDLNLLKLFPPPSVSPSASQEKPVEDKTKVPEKPWAVLLKNLSVGGYTIRVEDQTPIEPVMVVVEDFKLTGENISTAKNSKGKLTLDLLLNKKGTFSMTGMVGIDPVAADLKMNLKGLEIGSFQSYFTDKVKITLTGGAFSSAGTLILGMPDNKEFKMTYRGEASLTHFASIDKQNAEDFLKWESLSFDDFNVGLNPLLIDVKGISLTNFYTRLVIQPNGSLNLQEIMVKDEPKKEKEASPPVTQEKAASSQKEKESVKNIKIGTVTLQEGRVDFSDQSLKPEYSVKLTEIGGRVSGLSSEETTLADMELRGKLNDYAPLEITGKINPLKEDLHVDLKVRFKDMDLSPMTPYSGKYVGYTIEKGKLSFDLQYLIAKKKLDSQNHIFLDQFTLGDKIESPQATKLPVKLAIALLKDRKGEIKLDIPVTGSLDDPKFSVWGIILKILVNLIAKAATSPFSLLGAMIGGGEELSFVEFEYGSSVVAEPSAKKLSAIAKALNDRPSLKMDIEGRVDMEKDREGLKQYMFNRKLKAQKLNEMVKKRQPAIPVDEVKIEKPEYDKYLKLAYKEEKFPKPRNVLGMAKDIPVPEMEKLILTHLEIKDGDLRTLASQRAMKVKEAIVKSGPVEPERIFILEPKSLTPEKKEKIKDSRVDFKLK